uniref:(northern house mosquito) hypothetical protein n=1 Tax=Culex pipiens TaxID=7175 RepID=A0A8D8I7Z4_CULPI
MRNRRMRRRRRRSSRRTILMLQRHPSLRRKRFWRNWKWILKFRMRQTSCQPTVRCNLKSFRLKTSRISAMRKMRVCKMRSKAEMKGLIAPTVELRFSLMWKNNATWFANVQFCTIRMFATRASSAK